MSPDKIFLIVDNQRMSLAKFIENGHLTAKTVYASGCTARSHWGPRGASNRRDCLALVEQIAAEIARREAAQ